MNDFTRPPTLALSETSCLARPPVLVSWGARALYVGPSLHLAPHRNAVAVLAMALDGRLELAREPEDPAQGFLQCRSALIEPNQLHLLRFTGDCCAFLYLDALSDDVGTIRSSCRQPGVRASLDIGNEEWVLRVLGSMERSIEGWRGSCGALANALGFARGRPDRRILAAIAAMSRAPDQVTHVAAVALAAGLSASRFQHLFKDETGVPFRRYRIWMRLRSALVAARNGMALTEAAHGTGFSSSAHFSTAFKDMFGMAPSQLLALRPVLFEPDAQAPNQCPAMTALPLD